MYETRDKTKACIISYYSYYLLRAFVEKQQLPNSINNKLFLWPHAEIIIAMTISKFRSCANKKFIIRVYSLFFLFPIKGFEDSALLSPYS